MKKVLKMMYVIQIFATYSNYIAWAYTYVWEESGEIMSRLYGQYDEYTIDEMFCLTVEDDFSYFCKFWELEPILGREKVFPAIANSCYIPRKEVFG